MPNRPDISIIVPALNEQAWMPRLRLLARQPGVEVIVADGGSGDETIGAARNAGARVIPSDRGRGTQMNAGAAVSRGRVLLFLHADTRLPDDWRGQVEETLARPGTAGGAFSFGLDAHGLRFRLLEALVRLRKTPYGDQVLFTRRDAFDRAGGFPDWPALEDVELVRRLRGLGRVRIAPAVALTSARRWQRSGMLRTTWLNQRCLWAWRIGVCPERIARWRGMSSVKAGAAEMAAERTIAA